MENGKQPAFASPGTYNPNNGNHNGDSQVGLTKREYFAGLAMQSCLSTGKGSNAEDWIRLADALLKELEDESK